MRRRAHQLFGGGADSVRSTIGTVTGAGGTGRRPPASGPGVTAPQLESRLGCPMETARRETKPSSPRAVSLGGWRWRSLHDGGPDGLGVPRQRRHPGVALRPDSSLAMAGCDVPIRAATSDCDRPSPLAPLVSRWWISSSASSAKAVEPRERRAVGHIEDGMHGFGCDGPARRASAAERARTGHDQGP